MKIFLKAAIAVLISCSALFAADAPPADTAALVNGAVITTADFRAELARVLRLRNKTEPELAPAALAMTKKEALETLVGRELLYQQSLKDGVSIPDADVQSEISTLRKQFPSEEDFNTSLEKLGLTKTAVEMQIKRGMAIQSMIDTRFGARTAVTESEVRTHYNSHQHDYLQSEQIRLSHILVKTGGRSRAEDLQGRLAQGEDFALLARESDDSTSSATGGDLGYFTQGQLGKVMEAAAFSLKPGQVSPIVEDRFGFHILKLTERRPKAVLPFEDVKEKISRQLQRERTLNQITPYLKRLREAARVELHLAAQ